MVDREPIVEVLVTGGAGFIGSHLSERLLARGIKLEPLPSHQLVGNVSAEEQLDRFYDAYRRSLAHLYR